MINSDFNILLQGKYKHLNANNQCIFFGTSTQKNSSDLFRGYFFTSSLFTLHFSLFTFHSSLFSQCEKHFYYTVS